MCLLLHVVAAVAFLASGQLLAADPADDPLPPGAIARFGSTRFQHSSIGGPVAFSPDGKRLATAGNNPPVCIWDVETGRIVRKHTRGGSTYQLVWKADGTLAGLRHNGDLSISYYEWADGPNVEQKVDGKEFPGPSVLSPDGRFMVSLPGPREPDGLAEVFPIESNLQTAFVKAERAFPLGKGRHGGTLSRDAKTLIVSESGVKGGERIAAFDLTAKKEQEKPAWEFTYESTRDHRLTHCVCADGKRVVLQFLNGDVELWDGPAGKRVRELPKAPGGSFHWGGEHASLNISPDGKRLAIATRQKNGEMGGQVIDLETGKELFALTAGPMPRLAGGLTFSPDGKRLSLPSHGLVRIWNAETGADLSRPSGHRGPINSIVASPDGKTVVTSGADMTVRAWDPATGQENWKVAIPQPVLVSFTAADAIVVEYAPSFHLTGGLEQPLLDLSTGKARALPGDMGKETRGTPAQTLGWPVVTRDSLIAISPDKKSALTLEAQQPALRVWAWPEGKLQKSLSLDVPKGLVVTHTRARFTPDGKELISVTHCRLQTPAPSGPGYSSMLIDRWDTVTGKRLERKERGGSGVYPVWSPDGSRLLTVWNGGEIKDAFSEKFAGRLPHSNTDPFTVWTLGGMALSPDEKRIAIGGDFAHPGAVRVFDVQSGRVLATLTAGGRGLGVAYLPDGRLVTAGETALVWSAEAAEKGKGQAKP
jgi:WD40 repeat protein